MLVMKIPICLYLSAFILFHLNAIELEVQRSTLLLYRICTNIITQ